MVRAVKLPEKAAVQAALREALSLALETMVSAAKDTAAGATHEENRSEGDKDMRATEQSYLARGQAMRAEELAEALARFEGIRQIELGEDDPVSSGALVLTEIADEEKIFYVIPQGGGTVVEVQGVLVTVITPASPVGRALLGKRVGDDFELVVKGDKRQGSILALR